MGDDQCRQPGCGRRWTMDIQRRDGLSTFMCDEHGREYIEATPQEELVSVTSEFSSGLSRKPARSASVMKDPRKARRKAARQARRRSR